MQIKFFPILIFMTLLLTGCFSPPSEASQTSSQPTVHTITSTPATTPTDFQIEMPGSVMTFVRSELPVNPTSFNVEIIAQDLYVPWSLVFTGPQRILVSERNGQIREVVNDQLNPEPLFSFSSVAGQDEAGLLGLALDPDYEINQYLYASLTINQNGALINRVIKLRDLGSRLEEVGIILDNLPAARYHAGGRLRFGPDKKLYVSVGDALQPEQAQDINSLAGKILRINSDGTIPQDNPFPGSLVYSSGHRNVQGIDWNPLTNLLYATEHGPSGFDGEPGGDEINLIYSGGNYGWPLISHTEMGEGLISPLAEFSPAIAPASGMFYSGALFPQFSGNFFFGGLVGEGIYRVVFSSENPTEILLIDKMDVAVGRVRDIVQGPDGSIYFSTSNRDGRGLVREGDDKIYRLGPVP